MKGVSNEGTNTDKMQQHAMSKVRVTGDALKHDEVDLFVCTDLIDKSKTVVLNGSSAHAGILEVLAANPDDKALASDVDPELILKIHFKEKVNISAVVVRFNAPPKDEDSEETYSKPKQIKLFCNSEDLDFGDVDDLAPATTTEVEGENDTEVRLTCVGHKFQRIGSLQVLVKEPYDAEATRSFINRLSIIGHQAQSYHAEYK